MRPNNIIIVVEGTDGSGKSFIINTITPTLEKQLSSSILYFHLRPHWLPDIAYLFGNKERSRKKTFVVSDPHSKKPSGVFGSLLRWMYYLLDYTIGYVFNIWIPSMRKSRVIVFDRYYYDYYIDPKRSRISLPKSILKFGDLFVPSPELILCLGGDPVIIYNRKPETTLEEVKRQTVALKSFCQERDNAVWIDTTIEPKETIANVMDAIHNVITNRNIYSCNNDKTS